MNFGDIKFEDLSFGSLPSSGFGPAEVQPNFGDQFDGRLFKPYNKREKIGKLQEFSVSQVVAVTQNSASIAQQNAINRANQGGAAKQQVQTMANSQLVENSEDFGFTSVEDKGKSKDKKRGNAPQQT